MIQQLQQQNKNMAAQLETLARVQEESRQVQKASGRREKENAPQISQPYESETRKTNTIATPILTVGPFSKFVMLVSLSHSLKLLATLEPHERTSDPHEHLKMFNYMIHLNSAIDPILCRVFLLSPKNKLYNGFHPQHRIDS